MAMSAQAPMIHLQIRFTSLLCIAGTLLSDGRLRPSRNPSSHRTHLRYHKKVIFPAKTYPKQGSRPGDMPVSGCTVTQESGNRADCICRRASTKIDVHDPSKQSLICK
jgi:transposase InsO family protein